MVKGGVNQRRGHEGRGLSAGSCHLECGAQGREWGGGAVGAMLGVAELEGEGCGGCAPALRPSVAP